MKEQPNKPPNYKKIYTDIINMKFPEKKVECDQLLSKKKLSVFDILELNNRIFGKPNDIQEKNNQKHRNYTKGDIIEILKYQKYNYLNNTQLALHFKLSRNTVTRWKRLFKF
ncbi:hypothetical protein GCM10022217_27140 [Chryseobacterium ginsenosidimutans]|uniref:helix-turn-helix domain-containing protein n=1 Tax=Chryseobacterium ginsenosidimutans TaxID=687846 RepID=UPI0031D26679